MTASQRHPLNAPGPFYVGKDECISCMAPEHEAPELMGFDQAGGGCYFRRQPATPEELTHATNAVLVSCCDAVRYEGDEPGVMARIAARFSDIAGRFSDVAPVPVERPARPWWRFW